MPIFVTARVRVLGRAYACTSFGLALSDEVWRLDGLDGRAREPFRPNIDGSCRPSRVGAGALEALLSVRVGSRGAETRWGLAPIVLGVPLANITKP
jgi:hypothetical protein